MRTIVHLITFSCLTWLGPCDYSRAESPSEVAPEMNHALEQYRLHMASSSYQKALPFAERIAELLGTTEPRDPHLYALALRQWAILQQKNHQLRKAERSYKKSVAIVEQQTGSYAPELVKTLSHLGGLYFEMGKYEQSLKTLRRAQHIIHRRSGVYSLEQLEIVDWITQLNVLKQQYHEADAQQRYYYKINERNYGKDDARIIPALTKLGYWYRRSGQYPSALEAFRRTLHLMEELPPDTDLELLQPLREISSTLYLQGSCCADEPLVQVLDIVVNDPSADRSQELKALIHLADMRLIQKHTDQAKELYQRAWAMVSSDNGLSQAGRDLFGVPTRLGVAKTEDVIAAFRLARLGYSHTDLISRESIKVAGSDDKARLFSTAKTPYQMARQLVGEPLPLCFPQVLNLAGIKKNVLRLATFHMNLDFTVNRDGKVIDLVVVDSNTPYKLGRFIKNMLYNTRFRPRYIAGEPVLTEHVSLNQTFPSDSHRRKHDPEPFPFSTTAVSKGCQLLTAGSF